MSIGNLVWIAINVFELIRTSKCRLADLGPIETVYLSAKHQVSTHLLDPHTKGKEREEAALYCSKLFGTYKLVMLIDPSGTDHIHPILMFKVHCTAVRTRGWTPSNLDAAAPCTLLYRKPVSRHRFHYKMSSVPSYSDSECGPNLR